MSRRVFPSPGTGLAAVLVLLLTACSRDSEPDTVAGPPSLLQHVPADSPYVFVADRHLPHFDRDSADEDIELRQG